MLILTRRAGQEIVLDEATTIRVHKIRGNRVSLAVEAPRRVHVRRGELGPQPARKSA
jgi:carbon storage regulator